MRFLLILGLVSAAAAQTALPQLIAEAERNNPRIQAAEQAWRAGEQAVAPAGTLPDPQVMLQQMSVGSPLPFAGYESSNFAYTGVGVTQAIPYPGKLKLQSAIAKSGAQALRAEWEGTRREVAQQVAAAYIQLSYLDQTLKILQQQRALLAQAEQLAEVHYRAGPGSQSDVLAAQLAQTKLLRDLTMSQERQASIQAQLRALLNRAPGAPAVAPEPLTETRLRQSDDRILAVLPAADPELAEQQTRIAGADEAVALARKGFRPDFSAQYMYQRTGPGFRDYYQWTLGMSLPFFHRSHRQEPELEQAVAQRAGAQAGYQAQLQQEQFALTDQLLAAHSDERILTIDHDGLLPQARAGWAAALAAYRDGGEDLSSLLAAWRNQLDLEQQYWHTLADHETALSKIEDLTGVGHE